MQKLLLLAVLCPQFSWAIGSLPLDNNQTIELPTIVRVYYQHKAQLKELDAISDVWSVNQSQKFATIYIQNQSIYQTLQKTNLPIHLDQKLITKYKKDPLKSAQTSLPNSIMGSGIPGFACYSTVEETYQRMDQMAVSYPNLAEVSDIGDSWEKTMNGATGHDIRILKVTNQNTAGDKPILFLASAIHAREYATAELNTRFAEYLLAEYGNNADVTWILDNHEVHFSLQTNPDGRKQAETGVFWRKNTNDNYCLTNYGARGADLNRNYSFEWGGEPNQCDATYGGSSAESEPELTAQMTYIRGVFADNRGPGINDAVNEDTAGIFVDIHSYTGLVLYPWGFTGNDSPNDNQFQALSKRTAWFNNYIPEASSDLYPVSGASVDTTYGELGIASLVFEIGTEFFQQCDVFESTVLPDNLAALMYLARVTQAPYKQPLGPDIENLLVAPNVVTQGSNIQIFGHANDDRYSQNNGPQTTETVQSVTAYLNELPIEALTGTALSASDGSFDQAQEAFSGLVPTTETTAGKSIIYVQANDGIRAGGTYAEFIDVIETNEVAQLSGRLTDAITGQAISGGLLKINQSNAVSSLDGSYSQWVQPGTANLQVSANNYADLTIANLNLLAGDQLTQNLQLQPYCEIFNDDIENGNLNWTAQSPWAISNELSFSGNNAWSDSPNGQYNNNINVSLTSSVIDINGSGSIEVSYMSFCDTETGYDFGYFEVQFDSGNWQQISRCDNQISWQQEVETIIIPDNTSELKLRFRLTSDGGLTRDGWHIDDLKVKTTGDICENHFDDIIFINGFEG